MLEKLYKKAFPKSLWVYHTNTGACNGCDIEVINILTPYYDAERFGIKLVIAIGSCPTGGSVFYDLYNSYGGADKIIPVDYYIPGCPPRPEAVLYGIAVALGIVPKKVEKTVLKHFPEGYEIK